MSTSTQPVPTGVPTARPGTHDWIRWVAWIAVIAPIPYSLCRVLWAAGVPIGITEDFLSALDSPGWGSLGLLLLASLTEGTSWFTHVFVLRRKPAVPSWVPVLGGRPVSPRAVVRILLVPVVVLVAVNADAIRELVVYGEPLQPVGYPNEPMWSAWAHLIVFQIWGWALAAATFGYWRKTRRQPAPR